MNNITSLEKATIASSFLRAFAAQEVIWSAFGEIESIIGETDFQGLNEMLREFAGCDRRAGQFGQSRG